MQAPSLAKMAQRTIRRSGAKRACFTDSRTGCSRLTQLWAAYPARRLRDGREKLGSSHQRLKVRDAESRAMVISKPTRPQGYAAHREARARNPPLPTPRLIGWRYHRLQRPWSYSYRSQSPSTCSLPWASRLVVTRTLMWARSLAHLHLSISGATAALSLRVREAHGVSACLRRQRCAQSAAPHT